MAKHKFSKGCIDSWQIQRPEQGQEPEEQPRGEEVASSFSIEVSTYRIGDSEEANASLTVVKATVEERQKARQLVFTTKSCKGHRPRVSKSYLTSKDLEKRNMELFLQLYDPSTFEGFTALCLKYGIERAEEVLKEWKRRNK